jgi:hypothetical protein
MEYLIAGVIVIVGIIGYMIYKDGKNQEAREEAAKQARVNEAVARGRKLAESVEYVIPARHTHTPKPTVTPRPRESGRPSAFAAAYGQPHVAHLDNTNDILGLAATAIIVDELLDSTLSYPYDEPTTTVDTSTRYESCSYSSYDSGSSYSRSDSYSSSSDSSSSCSSDSSSW